MKDLWRRSDEVVAKNLKLQQEEFCNHLQIHILVHFKQTNNVISAIEREKQLKNWKRKWKIELIEKSNPAWKDLYDEL